MTAGELVSCGGVSELMSPDEMAVASEGLAKAIASRAVHRVPESAANFDDLKQVAWLAILEAARGYDPSRGVPFKNYAGFIANRAVNRYVKTQRRRGLRCVSDSKGGNTWNFEGTVTLLLGDAADSFGREDRPAEATWFLPWLASREWIDPVTLIYVDLMVRHGLDQAELGRLFGVQRQAVGNKLAKVRAYLIEVLG